MLFCSVSQEMYKNACRTRSTIISPLLSNNILAFLRCPRRDRRLLLLRLSITCGLLNSNVNRQMRFSLPSIKCSAAPPSFRLCWLKWAQRCDFITAHSTVVGSSKEPPNIWLTVAKNAFVGWPLNLRVRMLLKGAVNSLQQFASITPNGIANDVDFNCIMASLMTSCRPPGLLYANI